MFIVFLNIGTFFSEIRRSKVTDYAALKNKTKILMTNGSQGSILQYFRPALSYDSTGLKKQFCGFLRAAILHRFYCILFMLLFSSADFF